ncbi:non-ribosomal peptide synthetase [Pseudomonas sp. CGJS7]|uniref:non-ribosomal peptide synthetase n=1 Tax=Pseudomonas sp. CGJS7 TaxID=3109348 RepID=UPI00300A619F
MSLGIRRLPTPSLPHASLIAPEPDADRCVHRSISRQAALTPDAVAVESAAGCLNYRELETRSNRFAHRLIAAGVARGDLVAVQMERSLELAVALLGILKAGAAYVPIDTRAPAARRDFILREAKAKLLTVRTAGDARFPDDLQGGAESGDGHDDVHVGPDAIPRIGVDERDESWVRFPDHAPAIEAAASDLMYVLYTSGTTGDPKGVMIEHAGIANILHWMVQAYSFTAQDRLLQKTPYTFDASVWELFLPLISGGAVVMAEPDGHRDPAYLAAAVRALRITTLQLVPSMLRHVIEQAEFAGNASLRHLFCGGEALSRELEAAVLDRFDLPLHNLYGPTEASIQVLTWTCRSDDRRDYVPIGHVIDNVVACVLDSKDRPVAVGEVGELHLGGVALARGYLGRPEMTASKFVVRPELDAPYDRLYRTGDLVREHADGSFEFVGRIDDQIKIQGYRVELGEIESRLRRIPSVGDAAVIAEKSASTGAVRLTAYLETSSQSLELRELRTQLAAHLPDYMIPAQFKLVERFPLTAHAKLDKAALQRLPSIALTGASAGDRASNDMERTLAGLWSDMLGVESVGVEDDFFELGGDSMTGLLMIAKAKKQRIVLTPQELFRLRRIDAIVSAISLRTPAAAH